MSIDLTQEIEITRCEVDTIADVFGGELESTSLQWNSHSEWKAVDVSMFTQDPQCMNQLSLKFYVDDVEV